MANVLALVSFKVFPPHMGGQKGVVLFYEALRKHHQVFMAASTDNLETIEAGFEVAKVLHPNKKMLRNFSRLPALVKLVKEKNIDVLIAEHSYTGWLAWLLQKATGKPFIIHSHNIEAYRFRQIKKKLWFMYRPYERWVHTKAAHNFFISEEDRQFAIDKFCLQPARCSVITYGIEHPKKIDNAHLLLKKKTGIKSTYIFHFNGTLDYEPNVEAVKIIIEKLNPVLQTLINDYTILITGKRLPDTLQRTITATKNILYPGFVDDIDEVYQGSDLFINTVPENAGIKTKLVEALANNCTVVSTQSGVAGMPPLTYGQKIITVPDGDWKAFALAMLKALEEESQTPSSFFQYFSWTNIAATAAQQIESVQKNASQRS